MVFRSINLSNHTQGPGFLARRYCKIISHYSRVGDLGPALTMKGNMKKIMVRGEQVEVPFEDANYTLDGDKDVVIENRFGGEKATVPGYAAAVYDVIMGAQATNNYSLVQKGCDWFSRNFPNQYMVLLD